MPQVNSHERRYSSNKKDKHHAVLSEFDTVRILLDCVAVFASYSSKSYTVAKPLYI